MFVFYYKSWDTKISSEIKSWDTKVKKKIGISVSINNKPNLIIKNVFRSVFDIPVAKEVAPPVDLARAIQVPVA